MVQVAGVRIEHRQFRHELKAELFSTNMILFILGSFRFVHFLSKRQFWSCYNRNSVLIHKLPVS